jgi:hypothetical protein
MLLFGGQKHETVLKKISLSNCFAPLVPKHSKKSYEFSPSTSKYIKFTDPYHTPTPRVQNTSSLTKLPAISPRQQKSACILSIINFSTNSSRVHPATPKVEKPQSRFLSNFKARLAKFKFKFQQNPNSYMSKHQLSTYKHLNFQSSTKLPLDSFNPPDEFIPNYKQIVLSSKSNHNSPEKNSILSKTKTKKLKLLCLPKSSIKNSIKQRSISANNLSTLPSDNFELSGW